MKSSKRMVTIGLVTAGTIVGGGVAASAAGGWTKTVTPAQAPVAAKARTMTFDVTGGTLSGELYPSTSPTGTLRLTITNPMPFPINVTSIQANGPGTGVATGATDPTCTNSLASFAGVTAPVGGTLGTIPATNTATELDTAAPTVTLSGSAPDGCQGASFAIPVTVTAVQAQ